MNRSETFENTVQTLVDAFFNDKLVKGDCEACAVGNICGNSQWSELFCTDQEGQTKYYEKYKNSDYPHRKKAIQAGYKAIEHTNYNVEELARIEYAFEKAKEPNPRDRVECQFYGLMAVMDVLFDIHDVEEENHEEYKDKFKGHSELV